MMTRWLSRAAWLLAMASGGLALAACLLGQAGRWIPVLDVLNHFAPIWLIGGLLGAVSSRAVAAGSARRLALGISLCAVLGGGCLVLPVWASAARQLIAARQAPPQANRLKIIQYSFYHDNLSPYADAAWLVGQRADIVVLQESEGLRGVSRDLLLSAYPHRSTDGAFILSRYPLLDSSGFEKMPSLRSMAYRGGYAVVAGPNGPFTVVSVHLSWPWSSDLPVQVHELANYFATLPYESTIMTGDFNATPWSFALQGVQASMGLRRVTHGLATFPARSYDGVGVRNPVRSLPGSFAYLAIDNIFAGEAWRPIKVTRGPRLGSDHYPVVATLAWSPKRAD